ncbi:putative HTH-type transcriptional regulator yijO [Beauveria bassiana D1-5]|uniref:Putative HTH-type transcriptional regulator yijO n=2 Tax=cellular organisms TaxID=131567 RepID=A0A0A2WED2_BEABA|nr:AraC family transcriptional regulator [Cedecea neteri]AJZ89029.1 AraC family transcriptional regulator [Klebsiella michiganensis]KGQ11524.1 putative HTH-type transcriptional regulator yijO [Beauveria bassiana D1-5]WPU25609.1 AraC family transcriptional regulator [Cedecea neteri]
MEQNHSSITQIVTSLMSSMDALTICYFAQESGAVPPLAFQVDFPRLEIVLKGEISDGPYQLKAHDLLYVPAGSWNCPQWDKPATTLSILFGKQQLGFSVQRWDGQELQNVMKQHVARRGPRVGSFLLQALNEIRMQPQDNNTARMIVMSLLSHCADLLNSQIQTASRSQALFEAIRDHIDAHYAGALSRDSVAHAFYISPNYLSHLFNKSGALGFNEYLNHTRLEKAKALLKGYDLKVKEVAHACGFTDSNYFCRLFRKNTDRSPSEYRRQYHSQLLAKE